MKTYEFNDRATGEDFLVEAKDQNEAVTKAKEYFDDPKCFGEIDFEEAEMLGWDTYQKREVDKNAH